MTEEKDENKDEDLAETVRGVTDVSHLNPRTPSPWMMR
jgi:hypothetical protein